MSGPGSSTDESWQSPPAGVNEKPGIAGLVPFREFCERLSTLMTEGRVAWLLVSSTSLFSRSPNRTLTRLSC